MPTYSYRCKNCDHAFDIVQSFSDDSLTTCPECAGTLRKIFGNVGVSFKGSGFYRNDSRESATTQGAGAGTSSAHSSQDAATQKSAEKSSSEKSPAPSAEKSRTATASTASAPAASS